jgi:formate hydrogenlyase transcriptional activator
LTEGDVRRLMQYDWPGNVRELENVIERAAILARHARLRIDLPAARTTAAAHVSADRLLTDDERRERDRANILAALETCGGKVFGRGGAAELLDVKPTTLASRIKALGITIEKPRDRNSRGATVR